MIAVNVMKKKVVIFSVRMGCCGDDMIVDLHLMDQ